MVNLVITEAVASVRKMNINIRPYSSLRVSVGGGGGNGHGIVGRVVQRWRWWNYRFWWSCWSSGSGGCYSEAEAEEVPS